jgi:hypothetical protein
VALGVVLEKGWEAAQDSAKKRLEIAQLACFVLLGYARALQGEETMNIELSGARKYFGDVGLEPRHVTLSLKDLNKRKENISTFSQSLC